jgi:hypothetical protein
MSAKNLSGSLQKGTRKFCGGFQRLERLSVAVRTQPRAQENQCLISDDTGNDLCAMPQRRGSVGESQCLNKPTRRAASRRRDDSGKSRPEERWEVGPESATAAEVEDWDSMIGT